jgi:hypothetical protein
MVAWHAVPGIIQQRSRPEGYGMIGCPLRWYRSCGHIFFGFIQLLSPNGKSGTYPITPYPPGRSPMAAFPGTSCLATIIQSLRDKGVLRQFGPSPSRPFAVSLPYGTDPISRDSRQEPPLVSPSRVYWLQLSSRSDSAMARAHDSSVTRPLIHFPRRAPLTASHLLRPPAKAMTGFFE